MDEHGVEDMSDLQQQYNDAEEAWKIRLRWLNDYRKNPNWLPSGLKAKEDGVMEAYMQMKSLKEQLDNDERL